MLAIFARVSATAEPALRGLAAASLRHASTSSSSSSGHERYVYLPPGCSLKEPAYVSMSDPVYFDPKPADKEYAANFASKAEKAAAPSKPTPPKNTQKQAREDDPHAFKLVDDYAQQTYVYSFPRTSMREPRYVSITDPVYFARER